MNHTTLSGGFGSKFPSNYTNIKHASNVAHNKKLQKNFSANPTSFFHSN